MTREVIWYKWCPPVAAAHSLVGNCIVFGWINPRLCWPGVQRCHLRRGYKGSRSSVWLDQYLCHLKSIYQGFDVALSCEISIPNTRMHERSYTYCAVLFASLLEAKLMATQIGSSSRMALIWGLILCTLCTNALMSHGALQKCFWPVRICLFKCHSASSINYHSRRKEVKKIILPLVSSRLLGINWKQWRSFETKNK